MKRHLIDLRVWLWWQAYQALPERLVETALGGFVIDQWVSAFMRRRRYRRLLAERGQDLGDIVG